MTTTARVVASVAAFSKSSVGEAAPPLILGGSRVYETVSLLLGNTAIDQVYAAEIELGVNESATINMLSFTDPDGNPGTIRQLKVLMVHVVDGQGLLAINSSIPLLSDSNGIDMDGLIAGDCLQFIRSAGIIVDPDENTLILQASVAGVTVRVIALGLIGGR